MSSIEPVPAVGAEPATAPLSQVQPPATASPARARPAEPQEPPAQPRREAQPPTRLLIEDVGGRYVYTLVDRVSGQVLVQLPPEELSRLGDVDGYGAGTVLNTKA